MNLQNLRARASDLALKGSVALVSLVPALSMAQTDPFDSAVTAATTKIGVYGAALVGLAAVGVAFMIGMKYVKRIPRAS